MENDELETGEEPTSDDGTTSDDETGGGDDTSKDSDQKTETDTPDSDDTDETGSDDGLTPEEKARRDELLEAATNPEKEQNDLRSELGRERKRREEREAELLTIIDTLSKGGDAKPTSESDSDEPELYTPSAPFLNDDGSINLDALNEWNFRGNQFLEGELNKVKEKLESLGVDVSDIHTTAKEKQEAAEFQRRYGLTEDQYRNYKNIKEKQGDLDATDYLMIERKSAKAAQAAANHRDKERGAGALAHGNDGAPTSVNAGGDAIAQVVKDIKALPAGEERIKALASVPFKYSQEVSTQILRLVAQP